MKNKKKEKLKNSWLQILVRLIFDSNQTYFSNKQKARHKNAKRRQETLFTAVMCFTVSIIRIIMCDYMHVRARLQKAPAMQSAPAFRNVQLPIDCNKRFNTKNVFVFCSIRRKYKPGFLFYICLTPIQNPASSGCWKWRFLPCSCRLPCLLFRWIA